MIRFASDWAFYPRAGVHLSTTNKSFMRLASVYKQMGVKNFYFLLAIKNPEIAHLDPHSEELTEDEKILISLECRDNVWYFLREVVRIPPIAGGKPGSFLANRGNIALVWSFICNVDITLIQPRQTGKSVSTDSLMTWLMFFGTTRTNISLITKDHSLRVTNIERLKKLRDLLPPYLVYVSTVDSNNQVEITNKSLGNRYTTGVAQNTEALANNLGRGESVPIRHIDEPPFVSHIGETVPAALASGVAARAEAEAAGKPYGNIFTTTAGKKDSRDGRFMYDFITDSAIWTEKFFDAKDRDDLHETVRCASRDRKLRINATFGHRQLGKTDEWLAETIALVGGSDDQINRDFFNIWTSGTESSPLSIALNEKIKKSELDALHVEITKERYCLRWYVPENRIASLMASGDFAIGLDTSEAIGKDDIALVMIDLSDLGVVMAANVNETSIPTYSQFLADFMVKYKRTTLVIERKSTGIAIIGALTQHLPRFGQDPFRRIFNSIVNRRTERENDYKAIQTMLERRGQYFHDQYLKDFGFVTTSESRDTLYLQTLPNGAKNAGQLVRDKVLSDQIRGLVVKRGRIDHATGSHDDMVVAWLLAIWFAMSARDLEYYGVDPRLLMSRVQPETMISAEDAREKLAQMKIQAQLEAALEELQEASDEMSISRLEHKVKMLHQQVQRGTADNVLGVDQLLRKVKEERQMKMRQRRLNPIERRPMGRSAMTNPSRHYM